MRSLIIGATFTLLSACATFPPALAIDQLKAAKATDPKSDAYVHLADLAVACPARPKSDKQRDMACAQLWAFKSSGCLGDQLKILNAASGLPQIPDGAQAEMKTRRTCAETASANAVAYLPAPIAQSDADAALKILAVRASALETRRQYRESRSEVSLDDAELGVTATQMLALPGGAPYADFLTAGTVLLHASREADKERACALADTALELIKSAVNAPALVAPSSKRRAELFKLKQIRACR